MQSKEVAKLTNIPISTLRFYERKKLIPTEFIQRNQNNYRVYSDEIVPYLNRLNILTSTGFSIQDIQTLTSEENRLTKEERLDFATKKVQEIETKQFELAEAKSILDNMIVTGKENPCRF